MLDKERYIVSHRVEYCDIYCISLAITVSFAMYFQNMQLSHFWHKCCSHTAIDEIFKHFAWKNGTFRQQIKSVLSVITLMVWCNQHGVESTAKFQPSIYSFICWRLHTTFSWVHSCNCIEWVLKCCLQSGCWRRQRDAEFWISWSGKSLQNLVNCYKIEFVKLQIK